MHNKAVEGLSCEYFASEVNIRDFLWGCWGLRASVAQYQCTTAQVQLLLSVSLYLSQWAAWEGSSPGVALILGRFEKWRNNVEPQQHN